MLQDAENDDSFGIFRIFEADLLHVQFVQENPILRTVCTSAKNTLVVVGRNDALDVEVNIGIEELLNASNVRCSQLIAQKAFCCRTCRKMAAPIYLCEQCFNSGQHRELNHNIEVIELLMELVGKLECHCGDHTCTLQSGWCPDHNAKRQQTNKQQRPALYQSIKQHIVDCFIILLQLQYQSKYYTSEYLLSLFGEYLSKLEDDLQRLVNYDQNYYHLVADCLSTRVTIRQSNESSKRPLILHLLKYQTLILENSVLKQVFQLNYDRVTTITLSYLANEYLKTLETINEDKPISTPTTETIKTIEKALGVIISCQKDCSTIKQLAVDNIAPNKVHVFQKPHRHAVMKLYSHISKMVVYSGIRTEQWSELLTILDGHRLIHLPLIPQDCLTSFMLCASTNVKIFNKLTQEIQDIVVKKDTALRLFYLEVLVDISCKLIIENNFQPKQILCPQIHKQILSTLTGNKTCIFNLSLSDGKLRKKVKDLAQILQNSTQPNPRSIFIPPSENQSVTHQPTAIPTIRQQQIEIQSIEPEIQVDQTTNEEKIENSQLKLEKNAKQKQSIKKEQCKIKTAQEIAIAKKKQKLKEKYSTMQTKVLEKAEIERLKSNEQTCAICREPSTKQKQIFWLGNVYPASFYVLPLLNFYRRGISICQHVFHIECLMKNRGERQCPLCKQSVNVCFLPPEAEMSEKGVVSFAQMIALSQFYNQMNIHDVLPDFLEVLANEKLIQLVFDSQIQQLQFDKQSIKRQTKRRHNSMILHTTKQLYMYMSENNKQHVLKKFKEAESKLVENCKQQKWRALYKIIFMMVLIELGQVHKQDINKLVQLIKQVEIGDRNQIIELLPISTRQMLQSCIQTNQTNNSQDSSGLILSMIPILKYQALLFNQFKPTCKKYKNHYDSDWQCLLCYTKFCGMCHESVEKHRKYHGGFCLVLRLSTYKLDFIDRSIKSYQIQAQAKDGHPELRPLDVNKFKQAFRQILSYIRS